MPAETIWVLRPRDDRDCEWDPWSPWYDKNFGFIVTAETEEEAREIAQNNAGDETTRVTGDPFGDGREYERGVPVWTDPELSICAPIQEYTESEGAGVLMEDFARA